MFSVLPLTTEFYQIPNTNFPGNQILDTDIPEDDFSKKIKRELDSNDQKPIKERKIAKDSSPTKRSESQSHTGLSPAIKTLRFNSIHLNTKPETARSLLDAFNKSEQISYEEQENPIQNDFLKLVENCSFLLGKSLDESIVINTRLELLPRRIGESCASGCYVVPSDESQSAIVVKPANQEPGAKGCPTGKNSGKDGINPGESALRERMAWKFQDLLKVDLGIPEVIVAIVHHPFFGNIKEIQDNLNHLQKQGISLSMENLFQLAAVDQEADVLIKNLLSKSRNPVLQDIKAAGLPVDTVEKLISFCIEHNKLTISVFFNKLSEAFSGAEWIQKARPKIIQFSALITKQKGAEELIRQTYEAYQQNARHQAKSFASIQKFEENIGDLENLPQSEWEKIPVEEFHKLIVDVILFNTDRHLGNILLKKEYINPNDYTYKFILIDHGYCLPRPQYDQDCNGIKQALFEFLKFKQTNQPINGKIKESILQIDINLFIENLKLDIKTQQVKYPNYIDICSVPDECFLLIEFNLRLLKKGVELERSFKEIACVLYPEQDQNNPRQQFGGEIASLFQKTVRLEHDKLVLNNELFDCLLEEIFHSNRLWTV